MIDDVMIKKIMNEIAYVIRLFRIRIRFIQPDILSHEWF